MRAPVLAALALVMGCAAPAVRADDDAALSLADRTDDVAERGGDWRMFVEYTVRTATPRGPGAAQPGARLSFDIRYDANLAAGWRAVLADRLDANRLGPPAGGSDVNTLKEAYLSWQPESDRIFEAGRINARNGVATGYNPTDYFRSGALRSIVSLDPASLRENRLGSVMLRAQKLWDTGAATALFSPRLADRPQTGAYDLDLGATNRRNRWLLAFSPKSGGAAGVQLLLSGGAAQSAQAGASGTALLGRSTVAFAEWSGGKGPSLAAQSRGRSGDTAFRSRLATGLTHTTQGNLALTLEYEYNGGGLDGTGWDALRRGPPAAIAAYRATAAQEQDPLTRDNLFLSAIWTDAGIRHLDLSLMTRYAAADRSRMHWLEARYHWSRVDLALQAQFTQGGPASVFGASSERRAMQVLLRYFF